MTAFLYDVAADLHQKFGSDNLSKLSIIAPSRRTKLFMNKYFYELAGGKPLWAPKYENIMQLFSNASGLNLYADSIQKISLVWELYNAYKKILNTNETFDEFYFFGEILLNDFNDIDKALLDPKQVFRIISEHKELESFEHLDKEQIELIQKFFNFDKNSELQNNFFNIWNCLAQVYSDFNERLLNKKIAYEGMLMRFALDNFDIQKYNSEHYIFVGFNQISKAENELIKKLGNKAIIYEDNVNFKERLNADISFIEAANPSTQTGYINGWLENLENKDFENANTAIILCDEKLLPGTLSALPQNIEPNIAILYSLIQSQTASSLICKMEELAKDKEAASPQNLLLRLQEFIEEIAKNKETAKQLEIVALSECYKMLNALSSIISYIENCKILFKLIKRLLISIKLSYAGEPAQGLQIMAMSDTRNMDFENILMLSANDGIIPKLESESSFIPTSIRKAFKLPSIAEQEAEDRHNFFRLLKRAKNAAFVYNIGKGAGGKSEMSRYLMQILVSSENIKRISLECDARNTPLKKEISIPRTAEMIKELKSRYGKRALSPSAFSKFINCPLQFYFEYIAGIKKPNDLTEEIDAALIGNILHKTMELHYKEGGELKAVIEKAWKECTEIDIQKFAFHVIEKMAKNVILYDEKNPSKILTMEENHFFEINLKDGTKIKAGGRIDRIDKIGNAIRIVDYKTSSAPKEKDIFQVSLYSAIFCEKTEFKGEEIKGKEIQPLLLFPLTASKESEIANFRLEKDEFMEEFKNNLEELFSESGEFSQCENEDNCKYCDYARICGRL